MLNNIIGGIIGIGGLGLFLGIMLFRVPALPLIIICVGVMALLVWDLLLALRQETEKRNS
ncbi:MAG: hypothetical protein KGZ73_08385 [Rhizobiales bacterium]|jgi:tellurite resistance protein TehA-like permease|nr:hypothetical protein [Hyphomicrobiales bacterium]